MKGDAEGAIPGELLAKMPYREAVDPRAGPRLARLPDRADARVGGNVTHAAERAGMERESLHRLLKRYGIRSDDFKKR